MWWNSKTNMAGFCLTKHPYFVLCNIILQRRSCCDSTYGQLFYMYSEPLQEIAECLQKRSFYLNVSVVATHEKDCFDNPTAYHGR